jgi:hypothetical protein
MALPAHSGPRPLIQFRNHFSQTVGLLGRVISPSQDRYLNTGQHKHRINTYTYQTSMPWVGFEHTIPASKRAKIVHAMNVFSVGPPRVYVSSSGGDEKESLESEAVKYDRESHGTRTWKWLRWQGPAAIVNDRPVLSSERAPHINKLATVWQ